MAEPGAGRLIGLMGSVRWAFRCGSWTPSRSEWLFAARCIQQEEKERIGQFVFAKDAKSAMVSGIPSPAGSAWSRQVTRRRVPACASGRQVVAEEVRV